MKGMMMVRHTRQPKELFYSRPWGFSQLSISKNGLIVHIAGQVAWNNKEECCSSELEDQLTLALEHVCVAVRDAGGSAEDIQMLRIYVVNFRPKNDADIIANVLKRKFGIKNPPASTWVGVTALAQPEYLVEIDAVAVIAE